MARLREPDEVKTRRSGAARGEPSSWQVRQTQGLDNSKAARDKLKFDREKAALTQKNKEEDRGQKERQHQEKRQDAWAAKGEALRHKEGVDTQKSTDTRIKEQKIQHMDHFNAHLYEKHGETIDDKGTRGVSLDIDKRAAKYRAEIKAGSLTGPDAVKKFKEDYAQEEHVKKQYKTILPEVIKTAEAQKGSALTPEEMAGLEKASPENMAGSVSRFQEKQEAIKVRDQAVQAKAGENYAAAYPTSQAERDAAVKAGVTPPPMIAGDKPRYTADEFGGPGFGGNLPVRSDLNYGEAKEAYNDVVDRAVADKGGGFLPTAGGAFLKYTPGARDLVDPNTPLRTGIRKAGEAISGVFQGREGQMGPPAPTAPTQPVSAADLIPTFGEKPSTPPLTPAAPTSLDLAPVPGPAAVAPVPPPEAPGAVPAPVSVGTVQGPATLESVPGPAQVAAVPPPAEPGSIAPMAKPGNIFEGLADTVKGIFTSSPDRAESNQNIWNSLPQSEEPVTSSPAIQRPEDEETRAFPKAM